MPRLPKGSLDAVDEAFATLADEFCRLIETRKRRSARALLRRAHQLLPKLYAAALELRPRPDQSDAPHCRPGHEVWKGIYGDLVQQLGYLGPYSEVFDPYDHHDRPVTASLADDLADIYCDLESGRQLWQQKFREAAINSWTQLFRFHWSEHATGALRTLSWLEFHYRMARSQEDVDELLSHALRPSDAQRKPR